MSDSKASLPITEATLTDGSTIAVNDHVYLQPEHLGECYYIGRVMEFCGGNAKRRGLQARIAWYNRPKDVMGGRSYDPRLLVATMHSDLNPVSSIRGKCTVTHKHYIPKGKLEQYKKQDNHFYYHQLYDRYMQRLYDVIPCELVQNVPTNVQEALYERYQFIVVEQGKASADLTVARRTCCVCHDWCASASSVKCAACQNNYHMSCVNPPLLRKPPKGFAWQCAFCSRKEFQDVDTIKSQQQSSNKPAPRTTNATTTKPVAKRQTRTSARIQSQQSMPTTTDKSMDINHNNPSPPSQPPLSDIKLNASNEKDRPHHDGMRMTHMWPFRYFGFHTDMQDILDIDDRIYPRARSRIGPRYQAEPIDEFPSSSTEPSSRHATPTTAHQTSSSPPPSSSSSLRAATANKGRAKRVEKRGRPRKKRMEASPDIPDDDIQEGPVERGTDATVTPLFSQPSRLDEATLDHYMTQAMSLPSFTLPVCKVDLKTRIIEELERHDYNTQEALDAVAKLTLDDFPRAVEWTPEEIESFEKAITLYGHDLFRVGRKVPSKKHADVVRYFYQWKKTDRYEPVYSQWTTIYKPTKRFKKFIDNKMVVEDEGHHHASMAMIVEEEDEEDGGSDSEHDATVVHVDAQTMRSFQCANCLALDSIRWRRMPTDIDRKRKQFRQVLCDACGEYWLKYGVMRKTPAMAEKHALQKGAAAGGNMKRGANTIIKDLPTSLPITTLQTMNGNGSMKRKRVNSGLITAKKRLMFEPIPCAVCTILEPRDPLFICYDCGMSVHRDCYGISQASKDNWVCNVCENKRNPTASYHYECILCKDPSAHQQPLKKTSSYNWAHVLCAMCIPEIKFVDAAHLDTIEYVPAIDAWRWEKACHLCHRQDGACVKCGECEKAVHVQCAIQHGYNVGFEIISSLGSEGATVRAGRFGNHLGQGEMIPQVCCPEHNLSHKQWIQLSARDVDTGESCISVYATLYKQVEPGTTPAMRRYKALVLSSGAPYSPPYKQEPLPLTSQSDTSTSSSSSSSPPPSTPCSSWQPTCSQCPVEISPMWWPSIDDPDSGKIICHRCYWKHRQQQEALS
ncbi:phd finger and bah domain-containing protein [Lichtheimia corymbifera JMRC:FSU:9682]|uniref:Phd finger and bah domain-containing protein n=1 Tax=Lichtheimia corymbifera JMRC:FSU:9682 TaxID=1263082 RepID=A0A068RLE6_9FUNG|nr:phd finger and bah domain-containing protein [Lichtheimia corymbifera JMRC:FSU:9682]